MTKFTCQYLGVCGIRGRLPCRFLLYTLDVDDARKLLRQQAEGRNGHCRRWTASIPRRARWSCSDAGWLLAANTPDELDFATQRLASLINAAT